MRIESKKYPIDIFLCILYSIVVIPLAVLLLDGILRVLLGLPFLFFIPGYILIFVLFPARKSERGIDVVERIALSLGLSISIVPLIGIGLSSVVGGIKLEPILLANVVFVICVGTLALYRWFKTDSDKRFIVSIDLSLPKSKGKLDRVLTIILAISILATAATFTYVLITPKQEEQFTEFYWLGPGGKIGEYQRNLTVGKNTTILLGVANHERRTINYTVEVWLINQSIFLNESTNENEIIVNHMWFMDKITITLDHTSLDVDETWTPQWEYNYTFNINKEGKFKLLFLLFTTPTEEYSYDHDYKDIIGQKMSSAYREIYMWINVN